MSYEDCWERRRVKEKLHPVLKWSTYTYLEQLRSEVLLDLLTNQQSSAKYRKIRLADYIISSPFSTVQKGVSCYVLRSNLTS